MSLSILTLAVLLATAPIPPSLQAHDRRHLLKEDRFSVVTRFDSIPLPVVVELARVTGDRNLRMADRGQPFQATDVIGEARLPSRRLIVAGVAPDHCVLYFERGGFARTRRLALFALAGDRAELVWSAAPRKFPLRIDTLDDLKEAVRDGAFQDAGLR